MARKSLAALTTVAPVRSAGFPPAPAGLGDRGTSLWTEIVLAYPSNSDALVTCLSDLAQAIKLNSSTQIKRRNELVFDDRMGLLSLLTLAQCHN